MASACVVAQVAAVEEAPLKQSRTDSLVCEHTSDWSYVREADCSVKSSSGPVAVAKDDVVSVLAPDGMLSPNSSLHTTFATSASGSTQTDALGKKGRSMGGGNGQQEQEQKRKNTRQA